MKIHIFVATTQGLVAIQNIIPINDSAINSIVSLNGTSTTASISSAYHNFVKKGAGIIAQDFGLSSYRMNVSGRIDNGNSWQLAFYLAHAVYQQGMLGDGQVKSGDSVICATGEVNTSTRLIQAVEDVKLKQELALANLKAWRKKGIAPLFLIPFANADSGGAISDKIKVEQVVDLEQALACLQLPITKKQPKTLKQKIFSRYRKSSQFVFLLLTIFVLIGVYFLSSNRESQALNHYRSNDDRAEHNTEYGKEHATEKRLYTDIEKPTLVIGKLNVSTERSLIQANRYVEKALTEQFIAANFEVSHEAFSVQNFAANKTQLLLNDQPNVLAVNFRLEVNQQTEAEIEQWRFDLFAELVDLTTNHKVETHSELGFFSDVALSCNRKCFSYFFAEKAKLLAQDMGAILVEKINRLPRRYQYEISFQSFLTEEIFQLTQQLKALEGYKSIKSVKAINEVATQKEWFHQVSTASYSYTSQLPVDEISALLERSFQQLPFPVKQHKQFNHHFVFVRGAMPYEKDYIVALGIVIVVGFLLFFLFLLSIKNKYSRLFSQHNQLSSTQQALNLYHKILLPAFVKSIIWKDIKHEYQNKILLANTYSEQAKNLIEQAQWQQAEQLLNKALSINSDNNQAQELTRNLADFKQGYRQYINVKENEQINATYTTYSDDRNMADIDKHLQECLTLAPFLQDKISLLRNELIEKYSKAVPVDIIKQTQHAIENKAYYKALTLIDGYLKFVIQDINNKALLDKLRVLRRSVIKSIKPVLHNIQLNSAQQQYYFFSQNTLALGRNIAKGSQHFLIGFKGLSTVGQQTLFTRQNNDFYITDQKSRHGSILNNQTLPVLQANKINNDATVVFGGSRNTDDVNICQLNFTLATHSASNKSCGLIMRLNSIAPTLVDYDLSADIWPSLYDDLRSCWILMGESLALGVDEYGAVDVGCINNTKPQAYLLYNKGFYLQPAENDEPISLKINHLPIYDIVPIAENTTLSINEYEFSFINHG